MSWTSSAATIAKVDANGVVSGVAAGTATITASSDGVSGTAAVTVNAPVPVVRVANVSVATAPDTFEAYDPHTTQAVVRDSANSVLPGRAVKWTSSNPAVATIDANTGMLMGVDRGTVTITAESETKTGSASRVIVIKYRSIAAGSMHACDIASGGFVWCWGQNGKEGRIGGSTLGDNAMSAAPMLVPNTGYTALRFTQLSSYGTHTCGLATDNHAYCWGHNDWRQFATTAANNSYTPIPAAVDLTFSTINASAGFTCGVATNSTSYCWGESGWGQLGDGSKISYGNTFSATPLVVAATGPKTIDAAGNFTCALNAASQALCWGNNGGHLGNGATVETSTPTAVAGGLAFSAISAGNGHVCGVATDASIWCWGSNDHGQLGASAPAVATSPIRAGGSLLAVEVAAAGVSTGFGNHTCAISRDRLTAYCFGRNETGQLGNGTTTTATASNPIPSIVVGQKPLP